MNDDDKINYLMNIAKLQGVATCTVKNGTIIALDKEKINEIFAKNPGRETLVIFSKLPSMADAAN
jgi:hypothetical protein